MWEKIKKFFKWIADHTGISWIARKISSGWKWLFGGKANTTQQNTSQHEERSDNEKQEPAQANDQSKDHTTPKTLDNEVNPDQPTPPGKPKELVVDKHEKVGELELKKDDLVLWFEQPVKIKNYKDSQSVNEDRFSPKLLLYLRCDKGEYRITGRGNNYDGSSGFVFVKSILKKNENGEYLDSNVKNHVNKDVQEMLGLKDGVTTVKVDSISNKPFEGTALGRPKLNTTTTQQTVNNNSNKEFTAEEHASSSTTTGLTEQLPEVNSTQELSTPNNEPVKIDTSDQPKSPAVPDKSQEPVVNPPKTEEKGKPNNAASNGEVQPEVSNKEVAAEEHAPNLNKNVDSKGGLGSEVSDNEGFEDDIEQPKSLEVQEDEVVNDMQNQGQSQNSNGMADPLAKPDQGSGDEPNQSSFDNESVKDDDKEADNPQPEISANGSAPTDSSSFDIVSSQATTPDELQEPDEDKELARQSEANQKAPANDDGPNSLVAKSEVQTASNDLSHKSQSL